MSLTNELISQFVKATNDSDKQKKESTNYGTVKTVDGKTYVQLDGSSQLTPITQTANCKDGDRVTVMIKNHTAVVTGNISSPSARMNDVPDVDAIDGHLTRLDVAIANAVSTTEFDAERARIDELYTENVTIRNRISANEGNIITLQTAYLTVSGKVSANEGEITKLKTDKLDASAAEITYAKIELLNAVSSNVNNLQAAYATFSSTTTTKLSAIEGNISNLEANKLSAEQAAITYANIDFSNISKAAMEYFYAASGLIDNVVVGDGTITGMLVGVTISGDIIEGNTVVADKLVIKGEDGLYYKLNTDGVTTSAEQTDYNSLNGQVIKAKSITAEKVNVDDLVAFDATIGGFTITDDSIHSYVKDSEGNVTRGVHLGADGQINFGDSSNFIKYYKDDSGAYRLAISAASITYALNGKQYSIADLGLIGDYIHIGTYENEPCILLGENDSEFKLVITNTRIMFWEGSGIPAYFSNQALHIKKAVVEEELQQGNFVWTVRQNGNMGLVWKGGT